MAASDRSLRRSYVRQRTDCFCAIFYDEAIMHTHQISVVRQDKALYGIDSNVDSIQLSGLGAHLNLCRGSNGRMFGLSCLTKEILGFFAARFVTSLVMMTCLIGVVTLAS